MSSAQTVSRSSPIVAVTRGLPGSLHIPGAQIRMSRLDPMLSRAELLDFVRGASVIVSMFHDRVDDELLDAAGPSLRGVCNFAVGVNNIDLESCKRRGVRVCNTPDAVTEGTANLAWGLLLAASRRIVEADAFVRDGGWTKGGPTSACAWMGRDLTGRTLAIIGAGRIGKAVALRGVAFGMRVCYVARSRHLDFESAPIAADRRELDQALAQADVVSVHLPLTDQTRHIIDARRLALMKPTAILINTGRGPVIDEAALVQTLAAKRIFAAGLDVLEHEPGITQGLVELDNVVLTPHIGSAEQRWREEMTRMVSMHALEIIRGEA